MTLRAALVFRDEERRSLPRGGWLTVAEPGPVQTGEDRLARP